MASNGDNRRELFLIDGNSLAYRAFFALPESIATSDGRPTNAIFGFASMLVKILTDHGDVPTVVVWDAGMSGRKEISADYKAQRSSRPDLLKQQWPHLAPLVEAFGYTNVRFSGYEADDVIATLAGRAAREGIDVTVVTGDRDLFQLIDDDRGVRVLYTSRGVANLQIMDAAALQARYGIAPAQYADFATLRGDPSDGLPGVPGIGEKTAAGLLRRFGSLEALLEAAARHDPRLAQVAGKLNAARDYLLRALVVVRAARTLPLPAVDTTLPSTPADRRSLAELDARWGIGNVLDRATKALALPAAG
jgi:DNA polymerase I